MRLNRGQNVTRIGQFFSIGLFCLAIVNPVWAQDGAGPATGTPAHANQTAGKPAKAHAKASAHRGKDAGAQVSQPNFEEADKAKRLEEGRKKFFEQSSGFDSKDSADKFHLGGSNGGFSPGMGFKF
jgi:hypothetical protein